MIAASSALLIGTAVAASGAVNAEQVATDTAATTPVTGIHLIKHVIIITQENRSFDNYFGTFPGADGIPTGAAACNPDPVNGGCQRPYVDHRDSNNNDPHGYGTTSADVNGGKMNGFLAEAERKLCGSRRPCHPDVMGYHVRSDLPNYWKYASQFVLSDHMFEASNSWSLPSHLFEVSGWAAHCTRQNIPSSCVAGRPVERAPYGPPTPFAWTDITWLLHRHGVSWSYYLDHGPISKTNPAGVSIHWNNLPGFTDVHKDGQLGSIRPLTVFMRQAKAGLLPHVSWVEPNFADSEHAPALLSRGQAFITRVINAVMRSPDWSSTAIFLSWDDWGGYYDNLRPPHVDALGYGIRVPFIIISPYAKQGFIDHDVLSSDAILKFIEDDFLNHQRLNPRTDGRRDPRPDVRESVPILGDLANAFDFTQPPRPPLILNPCPVNTTLVPKPSAGCHGTVALHTATWGDT